MNPTQLISQKPYMRFNALKQFKSIAPVLALALAILPSVSFGASGTWAGGTSTDWNTGANWSGAVVPAATGTATINTVPANICTIIANTPQPNDVFVGSAAGTTGRVDHRAGLLQQAVIGASGNWFFVGAGGTGNGTYNLADTSGTGGTLTGFAQGSGNLTIGKLWLGGRDNAAGIGTFNMNSSGTLNAQSTGSGHAASIIVGSLGGTGTFNLDSGIVTAAGEMWVGNNGNGTGTWKQSGGAVTANLISFGRNVNNVQTGKGIGIITGGTLSSRTWFTLGFAGASSGFGAVTNSGGTINVNTVGGGNMEMGVFDPVSARFELNSGALNLNNNSYIGFGNGGNNSGTCTFNQNGGTVTFYSDAGVTVGGTGTLNVGKSAGGTYAYHLNGGTLTVPQILRTSGSGTFNFNGGTLKPTASSATFMTGLTAANVRTNGAIIDTAGLNITIGQALVHLDPATDGGLIKTNAGILTLTGVNTYNGATVIKNGTLALGTGGSINSSSSITVSNGATFDVSAISYTVAANQTLRGNGSVNGNVTTASGTASIAPGASAGTLTFNNNLNMSAGGSATFELSTTYNNGNDQAVVTGDLTLSSSDTIRIDALSDGADLDTNAPYVLFAVTGTTTMATAPALVWDGTPPANYLNYSLALVGNNVVLQYTAATAPTVTATANPSSATRNQAVTVTATVTPGTNGVTPVTVTNVQINASQIGGLSTASLVLSNNNVWTNTFVVSSGISTGAKTLPIIATDETPLTSPVFNLALTVVATNQVWDGGSATDDNWTSNPNWANDAGPGLSGDSATFAGTTRLTPNLEANYGVTGLTFDNTAGGFNIGTANSSTLTLVGGVTNNSTSAQTLNVPITVSGAQTLNAAAGDVTLGQTLAKGSSLMTVTGPFNTSLNGAVSGAGGLTKVGNGTLTLGGGYTASGTLQVNGGTGIVSSAVSPSSSEVWAGEGSGSVGTITVNAGGTLTANNLLAAGRNSGTGTINVNGGTITQTANNISVASSGAGVTGALNLNSGTITSSGEVWIGENGTAVGNQSGGDITSGAWFVVGRNNGSVGTYNLSGGTVTAATTTVGSFGVIGSFTGSQGTLNVSGGSFTVAASRRLYVGEGGTGTLNVSGTGLVTVNDPINGGLRLGVGSTGVGTVNLNGGTVQAMVVGKGTGLGTNNFNGGTLKAGMSTNTFMTGLTRANVRNGGAVIDSAGFDITIGQALLHSDIGGDAATDGGLTKTGNGTLTLTGSGTGLFTGPVNVGGGTLYANAGNAANNRTFSFVSSLTVSNGATLQSGPNGLFGWDGTQEKPITVNSGGTLVANGGLGSDVGVGTVTLAGGTLATLAVGATDWGSWRFDSPGDVLAATENSTVSAANVKFQNGGAIDVAATKTLNFTGTITDSSFGGVSTVVKSGGTGTLDLSGANTYTGNTTVSAGTLALSGGGSINNTPVISLASGTALDVTAGGFVLGPAQTLNGNGAVLGATILLGTVAPGTSIGTLTFDTAPNLSGAVVMEISTPSNADKIVFSGGANFGGTLTVTNIGASLTNGNTFDLFDGTLFGSFSTLNLPGGESHWDTSDLNVGGTLTFTNASPVATNLTLGCMLGESVSLQVIGGKNAPTDADNDSMTVTGVSAASSGTSGNTATSVTYVATGSMGTNTFTYTVTDALGATDTKTVTVIVSSPVGFNKLSGPTGTGPYSFSYLGIPGEDYVLEESEQLVPPYTWSPVVTSTATETGAVDFNGVTLSYPSGSFRTRHVP